MSSWYADYWEHQKSKDTIAVTYSDTFSALNDKENEHRFTEKERSSFDYIAKNSSTTVGQSLSTDVTTMKDNGIVKQMSFQFNATPKQVFNTSKDLALFANAHEIKHASLAYNHSMKDDFNIASLVIGSAKVHNFLKSRGEKATLGSLIYKPLAYAAKLAHFAFLRQEERICDEFALRAFPDTDVKKFTDHLGSDFGNKQQLHGVRFNGHVTQENMRSKMVFYSAMENKSSVTDRLVAEHPTNESRYKHLSNLQFYRRKQG